MNKLSLSLLFICISCTAFGQDLNAKVSVLSPKIQTTNKRIFTELETAMKTFLNGHKWCADPIAPQERFDCTFVLNVTSWDGSSAFSGELQVQSSRPVFNSTYSSPVMLLNDKNIDFTYQQGQTIDYSDQSFTSNLSSIMAFYAYVIIGMDYDTFSRYGGSQYFAMAQNVVNLAQTSTYTGWKAFDNNNVSRYWLSANLNDKAYAPLRSFMYDYHRNGLDIMADNPGKGVKVIANLLPDLQQIDRTRIGAMYPLVFYTAKSDELVSIFSKADPQDRIAAMNILTQADPGDGNKYAALQGNK
ncbi:MAG: DUF4835 family protein [Sphingobacteriales bacterium]